MDQLVVDLQGLAQVRLASVSLPPFLCLARFADSKHDLLLDLAWVGDVDEIELAFDRSCLDDYVSIVEQIGPEAGNRVVCVLYFVPFGLAKFFE